MSFTGKATYSVGTLPEGTEDVSGMVAIIAPCETPLLNALGDPLHEAKSTYHEWLEYGVLPNKDAIDHTPWGDPIADMGFYVRHGSHFRANDQIQVKGSGELMLVTAIHGNMLMVVRGYAGTTPESLADNQVINILGNAALEGSEKPNARFTNRVRCGNYSHTFSAGVTGKPPVSDFEQQEVLRTLLRDLENVVINGGQMKGIIQQLCSCAFHTGDSGFPTGTDLDEAKVNYVLRNIWENSSGNVDLIVVGGFQKRKINAFCSESRGIYESDFGICRIVTTRWMPQDAALFLDSSRITVLPVAGRSFHFKPLASSGGYERGELIGEYTLELKNEAAHGLICGLAT